MRGVRPNLLFVAVSFMLLLSLGKHSQAASCPAQQHPVFRIEVDSGLAAEPLSGRLIIMMTPATSAQSGSADSLTPSYGPDAHSVWVAAKEVHALTPQKPVELDPDELAYPEPFCAASEGNYRIQAVLDINHDFVYHDDASDGDLLSKTVERRFNLPGMM